MLGHVLYKVDDLRQAVGAVRERGFTVEYGTPKRPYNALVYFSQGPYLELLERTTVPAFAKALAARTRRGRPLRRFIQWDQRPPGWCGLCLEGDDEDLRDSARALTDEGWMHDHQRVDTRGRRLRYTAFFPDDLDLPFLMSHFSTDPRPREDTHPNGIHRITRVELPLPEHKHELVASLCQDPGLVLLPADRPMRVLFDGVEIEVLPTTGE